MLSGPKLVKIDVEGYEPEVLQGLGERLKECRNIILEVLNDADADRIRDIVQLLKKNDFTLRDVQGNPWRIGLPLLECNLWAVR
jgi:hypothetical protein